MADHKFKVGQTVLFRPKRRMTLTRPLDKRPYRIIQLLPAVNGEPQYRIRSAQTEDEFAASEHELRLDTAHIRR